MRCRTTAVVHSCDFRCFNSAHQSATVVAGVNCAHDARGLPFSERVEANFTNERRPGDDISSGSFFRYLPDYTLYYIRSPSLRDFNFLSIVSPQIYLCPRHLIMGETIFQIRTPLTITCTSRRLISQPYASTSLSLIIFSLILLLINIQSLQTPQLQLPSGSPVQSLV